MPDSTPSRDQQCVAFLQWALPRLGYRWPGFRKVRRQVCRRLVRRARELGLDDLDAYRRHLECDPGEWRAVDDCSRVTISRFYRDRRLWEVLGEEVLPALYRRAPERDPPRLAIWSAGCGAGEEPYTVALLLRLGPAPPPPSLDVRIVGSDLDAHQLERARSAVYPAGCLRELPESWRDRAFVDQGGGDYRLQARHRGTVELLHQDIRHEMPPGPFDLILCRNLAFTYFDRPSQERFLARLLTRLEPHGWLALGGHETLPDSVTPMRRHPSGAPLFAAQTAR